MSPPALLAVYCVLILLASLAGGWIPHLVRLTHTRLQVATSFVGGLMLGVGVLHLLPHAWQELKSIDRSATWLLAGFLVMFLIQRFFHFHHHDVPDEAPEGVEEGVAKREHSHDPHEHCAHDHTLADKSARHLSWTGAALGLTLHTLIDGFAVAASVEAEAHDGASSGLIGLGTFLVVILHKPFDAMAIATLMTASGWSKFSRHVVNALFALGIPVGMVLFHFGQGRFSEAGHIFLGSVLAFTAGTFICIAASDLLPELQFHAHDRGKLTVALIAGLGVSVAVGVFETTGHDDEEPPRPGVTNNTPGAAAAPAAATDKHGAPRMSRPR